MLCAVYMISRSSMEQSLFVIFLGVQGKKNYFWVNFCARNYFLVDGSHPSLSNPILNVYQYPPGGYTFPLSSERVHHRRNNGRILEKPCSGIPGIQLIFQNYNSPFASPRRNIFTPSIAQTIIYTFKGTRSFRISKENICSLSFYTASKERLPKILVPMPWYV